MQELLFWNNWRKEYKLTYWLLVALLAGSALFMGIYYFLDFESVVQWETVSELDKLRISVDTFSHGMFDFTTEADTYLLFDQFKGTDLQTSSTNAAIFLCFITIAVLILITSVTFLQTYWFYGITGLFLLFIAAFQFDIHEILPGNTFLIICLIAYGGLAVVLNIWGENFNFFKRFAAFLALTIIVAAITIQFSHTQNPVLALANYGIAGPLIILAAFVIIIAFDIVYFFLFLTTSTRSADNKNTLNFAIISLLYLGNVVLLFLKNTKRIDWDIVYLDDMLLLVTSTILGFWGYKMRNDTQTASLPFHPYGAFIYISMAIITFATVGYAYSLGNTPLIESIEDIIVYGHMCIGFTFLLYLLINFATYINRSNEVYKVAMEAGRHPVLTTRLGGLALMMVLAMWVELYPVYQAFSGYYNGLGDFYQKEQNLMLAEEYYKNGVGFDYYNFRSNYSLALLKHKQNKLEEAEGYYKNCFEKPVHPVVYASLAQLYIDQELMFEAMPTLKTGLSVFPKSGELQNNLGLIFNKTDILDSTLFYLKNAQNNLSNKSVAEANLFGFAAKHKLYNNNNGLDLAKSYDNLSLENNRLVLLALKRQKSIPVFKNTVIQDSILNNQEFGYYYNYQLATLHQADSSFNKEIDALIKPDTNRFFSYDLRFVKAYKNYYGGDRKIGYQELAKLETEDSYGASFYNNTLGLWMLENNAPELASNYFQKGRQLHNSSSGINLAISLCETNWKNEAKDEWKFQALMTDQESKDLSSNMLFILSQPDAVTMAQKSDPYKLQYLLIYGKSLSETGMATIYNSISSKDLKVKAGVLVAENLLKQNNLGAATQMFHTIEALRPLTNEGETKLKTLEWALLDVQHNYKGLAASLQSAPDSSGIRIKDFYLAKCAIDAKDYTLAEKHLAIAQTKLPFNSTISITEVDLLNSEKKYDKAYEHILQAFWLNEYNADIIKKYILISRQNGLDSYADTGLKALKDVVSAEEYNKFIK